MNDSLAGVEYEPTECSFSSSGVGSEATSFLHDSPGLLRDVDQYILHNNPAVAEYIRSGRFKTRRVPLYETSEESVDADDEYESEEYLVVQDPNLEDSLSTATTIPFTPDSLTAAAIPRRQPLRDHTEGNE